MIKHVMLSLVMFLDGKQNLEVGRGPLSPWSWLEREMRFNLEDAPEQRMKVMWAHTGSGEGTSPQGQIVGRALV